jgi:hypothetical protein
MKDRLLPFRPEEMYRENSDLEYLLSHKIQNRPNGKGRLSMLLLLFLICMLFLLINVSVSQALFVSIQFTATSTGSPTRLNATAISGSSFPFSLVSITTNILSHKKVAFPASLLLHCPLHF